MRSLVGALIAALFAGSALAQTAAAIIEPLHGDLSLNQGQGFQRFNSRVQANVGDTLMVGPGGAANLVYLDGCRVHVQPGSVVSIAPLSPCASGSFASEAPAQESLFNTGALAGGALFAVGAGAFIYGVTQSPSTAPASP